MGSFRPSQFGKYKAQPGKWNTSFEEYCEMRRSDNLPIDNWLRSLVRNGMQPLAVDKNAMTVEMPINEFQELINNYNVGMWKEVATDIWECGEVGRWIIIKNEDKAIYKESNLWGHIPLNI